MATAPAIRFGVVGSGWRTRFFLRLAQLLPGQLAVTGVVTRTAERGAQVEAQYGVPTFRDVAALAAAQRPEFVVASVPWAVTPQVTVAAVRSGLRVLAETPPAPTADGLRALWDAVGATGQVQVA